MSPKILHSCFSKLYIFLQLHWAVLNNEEWVTAIVVTSKVVKLDMIAFAGLWIVLDCKLHIFVELHWNEWLSDCIECGVNWVRSCHPKF